MIEQRRFPDVRASDDGNERGWLFLAQSVLLLKTFSSLKAGMSYEAHPVIIETPCLPHPIPCLIRKLGLWDSLCTSSLRPKACSRKRTPPTNSAADNFR